MRMVFIAALLAGGCASGAKLYSFGPDSNGAGRVFTGLDSINPALVTPIATVGNAFSSFNGGLVYRIDTGLFYSIVNDNNAGPSLDSFNAAGGNLTVISALPNTIGWSGLAYDSAGGKFYAVGNNGAPALFRLGASGATLIGGIDNGQGDYRGMAYDADTNLLYAISLAPNGTDDALYRFTTAAGGLQDLFSLGSGTAFTHQGGLTYGGAGVFYDIFSGGLNAEAFLEQVRLTGSTATLYDLKQQGFVNNGLAVIPAAVPEPSTSLILAVILSAVCLCAKKEKSIQGTTLLAGAAACSPRPEAFVRTAGLCEVPSANILRDEMNFQDKLGG